MTAVEIHKELVGDETGLPLTRNRLNGEQLSIPDFGILNIFHKGLNVVVTVKSPKLEDAEWGKPEVYVLPEGSNRVIASNGELRWRLVHKSNPSR